MLRPAEVCKRLGMPASTLRIYSTKFGELLSEGAKRPTVGPEGRVGHRIYNSRDLLVLSRAKELLAQGLTYDQTLAELRLAVPGGARRVREEGEKGERAEAAGGISGGEGAVAAVAGMVDVLRGAVANGERALELCRSMEERQEREIDELRRRMTRLEEALREIGRELEKRGGEKGWVKRWFGGGG